MDWTMDMAASLPLMEGYAVQGNLDPLALFGTEEEIRRRAVEICEAGKAAPGHVFNLGHGITPPTPISAVETLVETVQGFRR
jgi:uroporphyrinogen decarboxylase